MKTTQILVGSILILVVIFDSESSLGLVRLRVRRASDELTRIFEALLHKAPRPGDSPFAEITGPVNRFDWPRKLATKAVRGSS